MGRYFRAVIIFLLFSGCAWAQCPSGYSPNTYTRTSSDQLHLSTCLNPATGAIYYVDQPMGPEGPQGPAGGTSGQCNGTTIICADTETGVDMGDKAAQALATVYAAGGGTVDLRGFECPDNCHIGTADLILGDGTHSVTVYFPAGVVSLDEVSAKGASASILYSSHLTVYAQGTTFSGAADTTLIQEAYSASGVSEVHWHGGKVLGTGDIASGSAGFQISGPNSGVPLRDPSAVTYGTNFLGYYPYGPQFYAGAISHVAIYNSALTAAQVAAHYAARTDAATYNAAVVADGALAHWTLADASGSTAVDAIGGRNGTYVGGVGLGSSGQLWTDGSTRAALLDGTTGDVSLPSYTWFTGGNYTIEGWFYSTGSPNNKVVVYFSDSLFNNEVYIGDSSDSGNGVYLGESISGGFSGPMAAPFNTLPIGDWVHVVATRKGGSGNLYINGVALAFGTDVSNSTFDNLSMSGCAHGLIMDSQHGCGCYLKLHNVNPSGATVGAKISNGSGFAFGINSDQWYGGTVGGPIGLWDSGSDKFTFSGLDFESNLTSAGAILYAGVDTSNAGANFSQGDTCRPGGSSAVLTISSVYAGAATGLTVTNPGTGYGNTLSTSCTALTGSGTGLKVDVVVSAAQVLISNGSSMVINPYEENSGPDYICGSGNFILGAWASSNGSTYAPNLCSGSGTTTTGAATAFLFGPGSPPFSFGLKTNTSYIHAASSGMFDPFLAFSFHPSPGYSMNLFPADGPAWDGFTSQAYGFWGHGDWNMGVSRPHAGEVITGRSTHSALANPGAPTLTAYGGTGTTSDVYGLVCNDGNGGTTLPATPVTTVSGPAVLGALYQLSVAFSPSGFSSGDVGTHFTVTQDANTTGQGTITSVAGGKVTGVSVYAGHAGSGYVTSPFPGSGGTNILATSISSLTVQAAAASITVQLPQTDGCYSWTVLKGDINHKMPAGGVGSTDVSANLIDFGAASVSYSPGAANTTGDDLFNGRILIPSSVASSSCGSLAGAAGCVAVVVGGVTRYMPIY